VMTARPVLVDVPPHAPRTRAEVSQIAVHRWGKHELLQ
jgi:hypothetical protein